MFGLTRQEKNAVLFLIITALIGAGVIAYKNLARRPALEVVSDPLTEKEISRNRVVNINTASKEELLKLDGIGPALAGRILSYRSSHGAFKDKEEIKAVKGIGPSKYEQIKDRLTTE